MHQSPYYPLLITKHNKASLGEQNASRNLDTWTAVSGDLRLLNGGQITAPTPQEVGPSKTIVAARTAVGISEEPDDLAQPHYLYLLTIDGLECGFQCGYYGATVYDAAVMLKLASAVDAINLDGGGSTNMARIDTYSQAQC